MDYNHMSYKGYEILEILVEEKLRYQVTFEHSIAKFVNYYDSIEEAQSAIDFIVNLPKVYYVNY